MKGLVSIIATRPQFSKEGILDDNPIWKRKIHSSEGMTSELIHYLNVCRVGLW